ncbi:P-loop containing nucleoside triphosphate hydrolase protein [Biscogniauxia marginata]|nr:P-loop containing nucleoside triphosphate hydrolase protein [Biscogniauxia marginata]
MSIEFYQSHGLLTEAKPPSPSAPGTSIQMLSKIRDVTVIKSAHPYGTEEETVLSVDYLGPPKKKDETVQHKHSKFAVLIRRIIQREANRDIFIRTELCIQSLELCKELRNIVGDTYDSSDIKATPITIPAPYYELFFNRYRIAESINNHQDSTRKAEIKLLHDFIERDKLTIPNMTEYETMIGQGKVSYDTLWTLYPPNVRMYRNDGAALECWLCRDIQTNPKKPFMWFISGIRLDYDGRDIGLTKQVFPISFVGRVDKTMDISDLPWIPENHMDKTRLPQIKASLINRGKRFREMVGQDLDGHAYCSYKGPFWKKCDLFKPPKADLKERVVVDYSSFLKRNPNQAFMLEPRDKKLRDNVDSENDDDQSYNDGEQDSDDPDAKARSNRFEQFYQAIYETYRMEGIDDMLLLSPARIPAYGLRTKNWGWVLLDELSPVKPNKAAFESLQVDKSIKDLVESLVKGHRSRKKDSFDDFTASKGKGLVMLLHGEPGTGKTLTAESIAGLHGSPLYSISGGELSIDASKVESKLLDVFELCKRWRAILLVDEADVVMSKRESTDLHRSAIVAVWLRTIEYFEGIIFLTTNLVKNIDSAFQSRIHLTIELPQLDSGKRALIWKEIIQLNNQVMDKNTWNQAVFDTLGELEINGRVVKNLLRTAMYYARSRGEYTTLSPIHLATVLRVQLSGLKGIDDISTRVQGIAEKLLEHTTEPRKRERRNPLLRQTTF